MTDLSMLPLKAEVKCSSVATGGPTPASLGRWQNDQAAIPKVERLCGDDDEIEELKAELWAR